MIVGIGPSFGSGGESRAGCVSTLVSISGCTDCTGVQIAFWSMITPLSFTLSSECTIEKVFEKVFAKTQTAPPLHQYLPLPVISYAPRDSLSEWLWRAGSSLGTLVLKLFCVTCYTPMHVTAWLMLPEMLEHQKSSWSIQLQYKHLKPWNLQPFNLCQLEYCEQVWLIEHPWAWNIWSEAQNVKNHMTIKKSSFGMYLPWVQNQLQKLEDAPVEQMFTDAAAWLSDADCLLGCFWLLLSAATRVLLMIDANCCWFQRTVADANCCYLLTIDADCCWQQLTYCWWLTLTDHNSWNCDFQRSQRISKEIGF